MPTPSENTVDLEYLAERVVRELWVTSVGMVHSKPVAARTAILRALREAAEQSSAPADRDLSPLRALVTRWSELADMHDGTEQPRWRTVANSQRICADELASALALVTRGGTRKGSHAHHE